MPFKLVSWDIETLPSISSHWRFFNENISHKNIVENQTIASIAWQIVGQKKVYSTSIIDDPKRFEKNIYDDLHPVKTFHEWLVEQGDIVHLYHNGDNFDLKKLNTGCIKHGLSPLPKHLSIDTLKEARKKFKFDSNRLDFLGRFLEVGEKIETGGMSLWNDIVQAKYPEVGKEADIDLAYSAMDKMVKYNKQDVKLLTAVYKKLKPFMDDHPNINPFQINQIGCTKCGGKHFKKYGHRYLRKSGKVYQRYFCYTCNAPFDPPAHLREYYAA